MAEQHKIVLGALGLPQETIDTIENLKPEDVKDFKSDDVVNAVKTGIKNSLMNDNEFLNSIPEDKIPAEIKKKIESGQYARFQNEIIETAKKQLGLEDKDLADFTDDEKKSIKKTVAKVAEKYLGKKGNVEGLQAMQKQVQDMTEKLEKKDSDWQEKLDKGLADVNGKGMIKIIKMQTKLELNSLEGVKLNVAPSYITDAVLAKVGSKYGAVLMVNDQDEIEMKQKANDKLDVMVEGKKVTFQQALKTVVLEEKLGVELKEDKGGGGKRTVVVSGEEGGEGNAEFVLPDHIKKRIDDNKEPTELK